MELLGAKTEIPAHNWLSHHQPGMVSIPFEPTKFLNSTEFNKALMYVHPKLGSEKEVRECLKTDGW